LEALVYPGFGGTAKITPSGFSHRWRTYAKATPYSIGSAGQRQSRPSRCRSSCTTTAGLSCAHWRALEFAGEEVGDHLGENAEHIAQNLDRVPDAVVERVGTLWHFTADAQARIDALAVQEGIAAPVAA
jgi:hypothetical protein